MRNLRNRGLCLARDQIHCSEQHRKAAYVELGTYLNYNFLIWKQECKSNPSDSFQSMLLLGSQNRQTVSKTQKQGNWCCLPRGSQRLAAGLQLDADTFFCFLSKVGSILLNY